MLRAKGPEAGLLCSRLSSASAVCLQLHQKTRAGLGLSFIQNIAGYPGALAERPVFPVDNSCSVGTEQGPLPAIMKAFFNRHHPPWAAS